MNIGKASSKTGLPAKTIRYYEDAGLVKPQRQTSGYRDFSYQDVELLMFLRGARAHGFTIEECRELTSLYQDTSRNSAAVKKFALEKIEDIDSQIKRLTARREELISLAHQCHGDDRAECAILDGLIAYNK